MQKFDASDIVDTSFLASTRKFWNPEIVKKNIF